MWSCSGRSKFPLRLNFFLPTLFSFLHCLAIAVLPSLLAAVFTFCLSVPAARFLSGRYALLRLPPGTYCSSPFSHSCGFLTYLIALRQVFYFFPFTSAVIKVSLPFRSVFHCASPVLLHMSDIFTILICGIPSFACRHVSGHRCCICYYVSQLALITPATSLASAFLPYAVSSNNDGHISSDDGTAAS